MMPAPALRYHISGLAKNPTIVFLHGFMGSSNDWDEVTAELSDTFHCLCPDLPGHGQTHVPDSHYTMPACADLVISLLDQLGIETCHVVGYSMGGRLALHLLTHFPTRFQSGLLESASPGLKSTEERHHRQQHDAHLALRLETEPFSELLRNWYEQPLFHTIQRNSERFAAMYQRRLRNNPHHLAISLRQMGTGSMPSLWPHLPALKMPLHFVAGEQDAKYRVLATDLAELCPNGSSQIVSDAGHNVHFERPERYVQILKAFFGVTNSKCENR